MTVVELGLADAAYGGVDLSGGTYADYLKQGYRDAIGHKNQANWTYTGHNYSLLGYEKVEALVMMATDDHTLVVADYVKDNNGDYVRGTQFDESEVLDLSDSTINGVHITWASWLNDQGVPFAYASEIVNPVPEKISAEDFASKFTVANNPESGAYRPRTVHLGLKDSSYGGIVMNDTTYKASYHVSVICRSDTNRVQGKDFDKTYSNLDDIYAVILTARNDNDGVRLSAYGKNDDGDYVLLSSDETGYVTTTADNAYCYVNTLALDPAGIIFAYGSEVIAEMPGTLTEEQLRSSFTVFNTPSEKAIPEPDDPTPDPDPDPDDPTPLPDIQPVLPRKKLTDNLGLKLPQWYDHHLTPKEIKEQTYNWEVLDGAMGDLETQIEGITSVGFQIVEELPEKGQPGIIYLVLVTQPEEQPYENPDEDSPSE